MKKIKFLDKNIAVTGDMFSVHIKDKSNWFGDVPPFANFEIDICGVCNRSCFFCPKSNRELFPDVREFMTVGFYENIVRDLATVDYSGLISLCGLSEPFLHRELARFVELTKQYCPRSFLDILTNGDFITAENLQVLFHAGLDNIKISMYDGPQQIVHFKKIQKEGTDRLLTYIH